MWTRNYGAVPDGSGVFWRWTSVSRCGQGTMAPLGQTARVCFGVLCANKKKEVKRDFGDLRIRRSEGRVVNTPWCLKRGPGKGERAEKKDKRVRERERTEGEEERRKERGETERESGRERVMPALKGKRAESGNWSEKTMNAGGVEYGNRN
ncbi:hypothetical protein TNCV_998061 [Trichonephila clavipes]|nr:hypothetical protein TNCV_998061 [Trichonephila clavipes]